MTDPSANRTARLRRRRLPLILAINLAGMLALLLVGEVVLRARASYIVRQNTSFIGRVAWIESDPEFLVYETPAGKRLLPNAHVTIKNHRLSGDDIRVDTNSFGFRDREVGLKKPAGGLRVLALGDSITVGDYLAADQVWVKQAERALARLIPGRAIEVINAGIADVGLREELDILEDRGLALGPDWVVVGFFLNDGRPPWGFPGELGSPGFIRRHSILAQKAYQQLKLLDWVSERGEYRLRWPAGAADLPWRTRPDLMDRFIELAEFDWGSAWDEETWVVIDGQLERLRRLSATNGFRVLIVFFPVKFQVYAEYVEDWPQRRMGKRAAEMGFDYLDLLPVLRGMNGRDDLFFDHCHPREFANQVIGEAVAEELARRE